MTAIVAEVENGIVTMGADSSVGEPEESYALERMDKIFVHGDYMIGCCGSGRVAQIMRYGVDLPSPPPPDEFESFLVRDVVPRIRQAVLDAGAQGEGRDFLVARSVILMGCGGRLWLIGSDLAVGAWNDVAAIGSGRQRALAALHALKAAGVGPVRRRIELALAATAEFHATVRPPFRVVRQGGA